MSGRRPAGSSAVRDSRAKETGVAAADSAAPPPAVAEGAEPQPSAQGGVQQHQKDTGTLESSWQKNGRVLGARGLCFGSDVLIFVLCKTGHAPRGLSVTLSTCGLRVGN